MIQTRCPGRRGSLSGILLAGRPFRAPPHGSAAGEKRENVSTIVSTRSLRPVASWSCFTAERAKSLPKDDWRSCSVDFTGNGLVRNLAVANAIQPIAARHGTSVASVAVAWTLAWPPVTAAIVGARSQAQVDGWLDAATLRLSPEDLQEIAAAIAATGAGGGPIYPQR
jgi:aryl-alcohol dehydrogenase-like predicted oxidoreductase